MAPPAEYLALRAAQGKTTDIAWYLKKMLPGQRTGGAAWMATAAGRLKSKEYERSAALPQFFYHRTKEILIEVHMDDFHGVGPVENVRKELNELRVLFDLKASDAITRGRCQHLKRGRFCDGDRTIIKANKCHIESLIKNLGMEKAKCAPAPSLEERHGAEDALLVEGGVAMFRRCVGVALYLAIDRWGVQREVQMLAR